MKEITRVEQTKLYSENTVGNCLSACLSMIMDIPIDDVPVFMEKKSRWYENMKQWIDEQGYYFVDIHLWNHGDGKLMIYPSEFPVITGGYTSRGVVKHSVVVCQAKVYDPHPSQDGLKSVDTIYLIIKKNR